MTSSFYITVLLKIKTFKNVDRKNPGVEQEGFPKTFVLLKLKLEEN